MTPKNRRRRITVDFNFASEKTWSHKKRYKSKLEANPKMQKNEQTRAGAIRKINLGGLVNKTKEPRKEVQTRTELGKKRLQIPRFSQNIQKQKQKQEPKPVERERRKINEDNWQFKRKNGGNESQFSTKKAIQTTAEKKEVNPNAKIDLVLSILKSQNELTEETRPAKRITNYLKTKYQLQKMNNSRTFFAKKPDWMRNQHKQPPQRAQNGKQSERTPEQNIRKPQRPQNQAWPRMHNSRVLSHVNKNIYPENKSVKMQKKYSHKIITRNGNQPIMQNISDVGGSRQVNNRVRAATGQNRKLGETPFKMSNSKSQNQLMKFPKRLPKTMKKSNSTMQIKLSQKNQFTFAKNPPAMSRFREQEQRNSHLTADAMRKYSFGPNESASRSKSRKINLAEYTVTRLNKSNKSLQKHRVFEQNKFNLNRTLEQPQKTFKSHFPSLQNNFLGNADMSRPKSPNYVKGPFEQSTENLKSDYLASSASQMTRSHSTSKIGKSQSKRVETDNVRIISGFNIAHKKAENCEEANMKRSQSTNFRPKYVQNVFRGNQPTGDLSRFRLSNQIKINSGLTGEGAN